MRASEAAGAGPWRPDGRMAATPAAGAAEDPRMQRLMAWCVAALLVVAFYYNSYRYPLQINSSSTSPTYADTPAWLSAGKYALVCGILLWTVLRRAVLRVPVRVDRPLAVLAFAFLGGVALVMAVLTRSIPLFEVGFFFFVPVVILLFAGARIPVAAVNRVLAGYLYFALAVEILQVLLFLTVGRLPALAYRGTMSIRFGSNLDDPNGFGLLLAMLVPFAAVYHTGVRRVVLLFLLAVSALLTQSITTVIVLTGVVGVFAAAHAARHIRSLFAVLLASGAVVAVVAAVWAAFGQEIQLAYRVYMLAKAGSLSEHGYALELLRHVRLLNLLGLEPTHRRLSETAYVNILAVLGIPYLLAFLGVGARAGWRAVELLRQPDAGRDVRAFASGAAGLLMALYVGSLALPVPEIFPINLVAVTFMGMLIALRDPAPTEAPPVPAPRRELARV